MKSQFGEIIGSGILVLILPIILFLVIIGLSVFVINLLKLPLIVITAIISYALMYRFSKDLFKRKDISIAISIIFTVILSYVLYMNWIYLIVSIGIMIPLYGIVKDFVGSPVKGMYKDFSGKRIY